MRSDYEIIDFDFQREATFTGEPQRLILHTDGGIKAHTGIAVLRWGRRDKAFTIQWFVDGPIAYRCIPEDRHALHVLEYRLAAQYGYPTWWPEQGMHRGDVRSIGIEHVMEPDGSWSQETRITSVLLGAGIIRRWPNLSVSEHAEWDPWTRSNDVGKAIWLPDWLMDVEDVLAGREPYRTVGPISTGAPGAVRTTPAPPQSRSREEDLNQEDWDGIIATINAAKDDVISQVLGGTLRKDIDALRADLSSHDHNTVPYTVKAGDNIFRIAMKFNTTVDALTRINTIPNLHAIPIGTVLRIPLPAGVQT